MGDDIINDMLFIAQEQVDNLNEEFSNSISGLKAQLGVNELTKDQYLTEINNIYNANSNFLVYKTKIVPIEFDKYDNPFRVLKKSEIQNYIKSKDYWANDVAIEAICDKLQINIIPIEKYTYEKKKQKS